MAHEATLLHLDVTAGAAGDMLLGALLDLLLEDQAGQVEQNPGSGMLPGAWLRQVEGLLAREPSAVCSAKRVVRCGVPALKIDFFAAGTHADHHHSPHGSRTLPAITRIIEEEEQSGRLSAAAALMSKRAFSILAQAEAAAHNTSPDKVHFHEVGAFDSIMDIIGFCAALILLGPVRVTASPVTTGTGSIHCAHGILPVPPPAVSAILDAYSMAQTGLALKGECLTPTGAALLAASVEEWRSDDLPGELLRIGAGAGNRDNAEKPNIVTAALRQAP